MRILLLVGASLALFVAACAPRPMGGPGPGATSAQPGQLTSDPAAAATAHAAVGRAAAAGGRRTGARATATARAQASGAPGAADSENVPATDGAGPSATPAVADGRSARQPVQATPAPGAGPVSALTRLLPRAGAAGTAPRLDGLLDPILPESNTEYAVVLEDLASGARAAVNEGDVFPSASLYKLGVAWFIMREVDAGRLSLDAALDIEDEDTVEDEPDGGVAAGDSPTVREALSAMLEVSSNAAAHAFLRVLGRSNLNQEMARIGLSQTRVPDDSLPVTSAADMARLLRLIATSPELSDASRSELLQCLANIAPPDALRDTLSESVDILDKTGNLEDASNVGALLASPRSTAILVVLDQGVDPGDARAIIAQAGAAAYRTLLSQ